MIRFGIICLVLCEWLLSINLSLCLWWLLRASHGHIVAGGDLFVASLGFLAIASGTTGYWLVRRDKRGWYASNILGALLLFLGCVLFVWLEKVGFPARYQKAAGAAGLIAIAFVIPSVFGLIFLNLPKTRRQFTDVRLLS